MFAPFAGVAASADGALLATTLLFGAPVATALEGIDLSTPVEPAADGECARLIQIKYPFLSCTNGEVGLANGDETWENTRQIPQLGGALAADGNHLVAAGLQLAASLLSKRDSLGAKTTGSAWKPHLKPKWGVLGCTGAIPG